MSLVFIAPNDVSKSRECASPWRALLVRLCLSFGVLLATALLLSAPIVSAEEPVRLLFVGDVMLDWTPGEMIEKGKDPFAGAAKLFGPADVAIGNLECVVSTRGERLDKKYTFHTHPRCVPLLAKYFHALSTANNHTGDFGQEALLDMLKLVSESVPVFGAGQNLAEARRPFLLERRGVRIAVLGYNEFKPRSFAAGEKTPGCAWSVDEHVLEDLRRARSDAKADVVIPFMHWGDEYEPEPNDRQRSFSRRMIEAGASIVVGGHPHCTQGVEYHAARPAVYSLGNFLFDREEGLGRIGWALRLTVDRQGVVAWDTITVRLDDHGLPSLDVNELSPSGNRESTQIIKRKPSLDAWPSLP